MEDQKNVNSRKDHPYSTAADHESNAAADRDTNMIDSTTGQPNWLNVARDAYKNSTDYLDANIRKQVEKNISLFRNKHPAGSKYSTESYKYRSKVFRPKTRSAIRRHEAAAALAFFSTMDTVSCQPEDPKDEDSVKGARYGQNWLEYRLEHSITWFQTLIGAYQDAMTTGLVVSRQEWILKKETKEYQVPDFGTDGLINLDENDETKYTTMSEEVTVVDKPEITAVPFENFRFSTAADWRDPVGTSPFLIELMPMFVGDVLERMNEDNEKTGEKKWFSVPEGELRQATHTGDFDTTRRVREGQRSDSMDEQYQLNQFDIIWVHRNIIRYDDVDYLYYTLGVERLLSDPVPVEEVYFHGRPYVAGSVIIETHRNYPSGVPELLQDLQVEANDLSNQTLDNVKLILNKRYLVKRGKNTDYKALTRSVPGGLIQVDDMSDVKEEKFIDISQSTFESQNRVNADFDEISGNFSNGSVQTNRSLNETVGGMAMTLDDSNIITEYQLRVFTETYVEPLLRQLITMGQKYETDERVLRLIGEGAEPSTVAQLMDTTYGVKVAVGFGATSPHKRIEKLTMGLKAIGEYLPGKIAQINGDEVVREVFGALGYRDGSRFFTPEENQDPQVKQLQDEIGRLTRLVETKQLDNETAIQIAQIKEQGAAQRKQMEIDAQQAITEINMQLEYIDKQIAAEKNDIVRGELILQQQALEFKKKDREIELLTNERDRMSAVLMNDQYQMVPAAEG
jgi:hypothetical protein